VPGLATGSLAANPPFAALTSQVTAPDIAIERIAASPLLKNIEGHIVTVGADNDYNQQRLDNATKLLRDTGHQIQSHLLQGEVIQVLEKFQQDEDIQLKIMGAYGHSRIREFFLGSNTSRMIGSSPVPLLLLR
jgi:nucleotide-binding universal stress UspA family protein